jgi:hypothetical protein
VVGEREGGEREGGRRERANELIGGKKTRHTHPLPRKNTEKNERRVCLRPSTEAKRKERLDHLLIPRSVNNYERA